MGKRLPTAMLCLLLLLVLNGAVSAAAPGDSGFYRIGSAPGVTVAPLTPGGEPTAAELYDADGDGWEEIFYPGSAALEVTLDDTTAGASYLLLIRAAEDGTVFYADQKQGGGPLTFLARFLLPEEQTEMELCISSGAAGFSPLHIPLAYTPSAVGSGSWEEPGQPLPPPEEPEEPEPPLPPPEGPEEPEPTVPPVDPPEPDQPWLSCLRDEECPMNAYSDLDPGAWYHDGIHYALEKGIMNGYDGGLFSPRSAASRAMLVTILWRMEDRPTAEAPMTFADVDAEAWYAEAVRWAASQAIVSGYDETIFAPSDPVTREQFAVILYRYARMKGEYTGDASSPLPGFADAGEISGWAYEAVCWMTAKGILQGTGDDLLSPKGTATRAQIATMLMRWNSME